MRVPGEGPRDAKIVFIGEAPGENEEREGRPFVGGSGQLFNQILAACGIDRRGVYVTNTVKLRPPRNDFSIYYLDKRRLNPSQMLLAAYAELGEELREIKPNVIVPLGDEALRAVTGRRGIGKWRGSILSSKLGKVVPAFHPAYILRQYNDRPILEHDIRRALQESTTPDVSTPSERFTLNPSIEQVLSFLAKPHERLSYDIETTGSLVRCLGLSSTVGEAICIPFISFPNQTSALGTNHVLFPSSSGSETPCSHWPRAEEWLILRELDRLFRSGVPLVGQNLPFDCVILAKEFGFSFTNVHLDTMLAHHTCYCEMPKGLDFLCSFYTRSPYYSDYDASSDLQTWVYNCRDASITLECSYALDREMAELGVEPYYRDFKHPAMLAYCRAETRGVRVDQALRTDRAVECRQNVARLTEQITSLVNIPGFKPTDHQVRKYFYETLRLPPMLNKKTHRPSIDKDARRKLAKKYPQHRPLLELLDQLSSDETLLSNFLDKPLGPDGLMRTHYNPAGTDTDRLSSSEPLFDVGTNLQNIPKGIFRRMFVAKLGWRFFVADLSQAEFRIVCWLAGIRRLIERYLRDPNFDVHTWVASLIFKKEERDVEKKRSDGKLSERDIAKNGVYGGNYKMHYATAADTYKIDIEVARFVLDAYRAAIPEVPAWWGRVWETLNARRVLENPFGRRRIFFGRMDDELLRTALSDSAQCIVAGVINRAFALSDETFDDSECYPLLQVHDEIVFEVKGGHEERYRPRIRNLLEYPLRFPGVPEPLVIPAEIGLGDNWYDAKEGK